MDYESEAQVIHALKRMTARGGRTMLATEIVNMIAGNPLSGDVRRFFRARRFPDSGMAVMRLVWSDWATHFVAHDRPWTDDERRVARLLVDLTGPHPGCGRQFDMMRWTSSTRRSSIW